MNVAQAITLDTFKVMSSKDRSAYLKSLTPDEFQKQNKSLSDSINNMTEEERKEMYGRYARQARAERRKQMGSRGYRTLVGYHGNAPHHLRSIPKTPRTISIPRQAQDDAW
jgi:hypothetical protein